MNSPALPSLPPRDSDAHKGTFGRALLIGGSRGMAGSISLSGSAALRSGAGLATVVVPDRCLDTVASFDRCYTTVGLPDDAKGFYEVAGSRLMKTVADSTAIGCGPGTRTGEGAKRIVRLLCTDAEDTPKVLDADALNCLAVTENWRDLMWGSIILTPHPGEWSRLAEVDATDREGQSRAANELAAEKGIVIVLKGSGTLVTDGTTSFVNETGNVGMATGGSGDVLTGVITALLCQGMSPLDAARLGVHIHGLAGDIASEQIGHVGMTAEDILGALPQAFRKLP